MLGCDKVDLNEVQRSGEMVDQAFPMEVKCFRDVFEEQMFTLVQGWGNKTVGTETQDEGKDGLRLASESLESYRKVMSRWRHTHS